MALKFVSIALEGLSKVGELFIAQDDKRIKTCVKKLPTIIWLVGGVFISCGIAANDVSEFQQCSSQLLNNLGGLLLW